MENENDISDISKMEVKHIFWQKSKIANILQMNTYIRLQ